jgi:hypothetical protein
MLRPIQRSAWPTICDALVPDTPNAAPACCNVMPSPNLSPNARSRRLSASRNLSSTAGTARWNWNQHGVYRPVAMSAR